jgi:hypothetical protein
MLPLKLTDDELAQIQNACRPLLPAARHAFVLEVANVLSAQTEIGPGSVHRAIVATQRRFFDPPLDGNGRLKQGKYA